MSIKIMTEVWTYAPVDQGTLLVLLALADSADEGSRSCYPGIDALARRSRLSPRQVIRCIADLERNGILTVKRGASPVKTNVYQIEPVDGWRSAILSPTTTEAEVTFRQVRSDTHVTSDVTPMSPKPSVTASIEPSEDSAREQLTLLSEDPTPATSATFEDFWKVFPKKAAKDAARRAWAKAIKRERPERIIEAARSYAQSDNVARGFVKYPQGWLNDGRWMDEALPVQAPKQSGEWWGEVVR